MCYTWCIKVVGIRHGSQLRFLYFLEAKKGFFLFIFHMGGPCFVLEDLKGCEIPIFWLPT